MSVHIGSVTGNSCAYIGGVRPGDELVSINDNEIMDVLDYRFYQLERSLKLVIVRDGKELTLNLHKPEYEELGLEFDTYLIDSERSCRNNCIFCFIDQLPRGLRDTLYYKDDDSRLSFLFGNYITLTNLTQHEIDRIVKMHISPVNISVHTTNPELRCKMMNNRFAGESLKIMEHLANSGIAINCQIVVCPGINDGKELERSLTDLEKLGVNSVAVVPVGLTDHREGLYPLTPVDSDCARAVIAVVEAAGDRCKDRYSRRIMYAADELYLKADCQLPDAEFYEDFACLENGVGMIALLRDEFLYALSQKKSDKTLVRRMTIACGVSVAPMLTELFTALSAKFPGVSVNVVPIVNDYFGTMINVTGLVVGSDLISQLRGTELFGKLLISSSMLRFEGDLFLDNTSLADVSRELMVEVVPLDNDGGVLLNEILR